MIGAGLAGAAVARALAERGRPVTVLEADQAPAAAASGNPAGVVKPFVTRDESPTNAFYRFAYATLQARLGQDDWAARCRFTPCGVLQLVQRPYPPRDDYHLLDATAASRTAGCTLASPALWFADGGWLSPARLCSSLLDHPLITVRCGSRVLDLQVDEQARWTAHLPDAVHTTDTAVLATGSALAQTRYTETLPLTPARGQISQFALAPGSKALRCVVSGHHYALPDGHTVHGGATFERDDTDTRLRPADHASNRQALTELLPEFQFDDQALDGRAAVRATTPDRLPLLGPVPRIDEYRSAYVGLQHGQSAAHFPAAPLYPGLYVAGGLGSRGIVTAMACGELLAEHLCGHNTPMQTWMPLLHPARFCVRQLRRSQN